MRHKVTEISRGKKDAGFGNHQELQTFRKRSSAPSVVQKTNKNDRPLPGNKDIIINKRSHNELKRTKT